LPSRHRVNVGVERTAVAFPCGDVITVPRSVATKQVTTFASVGGGGLATGVLGIGAKLLSWLPRSAAERLVAGGDDGDAGGGRFWVVAEARRDFAEARVVIEGVDVYRTTAVIAAWAAQKIAARGAGPVGVRAPSEVFRADLALQELAAEAGLVVNAP
jgi:hypothetical protein